MRFMELVKLLLVLLSVAIVVGPIAGVLYFYRDNLSSLVLPPQINNLLQGNQTVPEFQPPQPSGAPQYNPQNGTFTLSYTFTNPFDTTITITNLTGEVKAKDYNLILGNVTLKQPVSIAPKQTATLTTTGTIDPTAVSQIKAQNPNTTSVEVSLEDVSVTAGGISVQIGEVPNVGQVPLGGS